MTEQNTKQEVAAAHASKHRRRLAKSDIFSGITTATLTNGKDPPTIADLVGAMLIKNKDKEYVANSGEKAAMVDREGDTLTETEAKEVPKAAKMLKRVLSKNKENKKPPDGEGGALNDDNSEGVKTQAQPKLARLLKRVLKDSKGSTERDRSTEDAPIETNKEDKKNLMEEESVKLSSSAKALLIRALRNRAAARRKAAAAAAGEGDKGKVDEGEKEGEGDSQTKSETQVQPKLARVLKRILTDKRKSEERQDEDRGGGGKENGETKREEQKGTTEVGTFELTPSTKGLLVRALRKRAESRKKKAPAEDEGLNEIVDEPNSENQSQSEKQAQPKLARVLKRILADKRESEERQDEDRGGGETENGETKREEQKGTTEVGTFKLTRSTKSVLVRALRRRAESRKQKAVADGEDWNELTEIVYETPSVKGQQKDEGKKQGETEDHRMFAMAQVLNRLMAANKETENRQDEDKGEAGKEDSSGAINKGQEDVVVISESMRSLMVKTLKTKAVAKIKKKEEDKGISGGNTGSTHDNQENQDDTEASKSGPDPQDQGPKESKADDEVQNGVEDSDSPGQNKPKVNRMVKRAFSKNKKRKEFQSSSSQDEGFSSVVQRSIDLQDAEKNRTEERGEQQDKTTEQKSSLEDNPTPPTVLEEEKESKTKDPGEEEIKAKEANGENGVEGGERVEMAEENAANGGDSPHVSTADSEPGRCSGACVII